MALEFNVDLPPTFKYDKEKEVEDTLNDIERYILSLHAALETVLRDLFGRLSNVADSPTADNLATVDEDGNVTDSGTALTVLTGQKLNSHIAPDGSVDFNDQQAIDFIVENRTDDTGMTVTGQIWFRTDI